MALTREFRRWFAKLVQAIKTKCEEGDGCPNLESVLKEGKSKYLLNGEQLDVISQSIDKLRQQATIVAEMSHGLNGVRNELRSLSEKLGRNGADETNRRARERLGGTFGILFVFVFGMALSTAVEGLFMAPSDDGRPGPVPQLDRLPGTVTFFFLVVPLFHAVARHVQIVHVRDNVTVAMVAVDYLFIFVQGLALYAMALSIPAIDGVAITAIGVMAVDWIWCFYSARAGRTQAKSWLWIDSIYGVLVAVLWLRLGQEWLKWCVPTITAVRFVVDYWWNWNYYLSYNDE